MKPTISMLVLLLTLPVLASEGDDAETRFHDAYFAEVVEGKIDEAARVYYELMEAGSTPARIRREARFRFAVCCVLLGRADEGRSRLAELLAEPDLPASLMTRAGEYKKAIEGVGVGTETEKRLEQLVFELGRVPEENTTKAYRDFQIVGQPAVPTLRRLLAHPDRALRVHAFRILCAMDEPGMAEAWRLPYVESRPGHFAEYLDRNPGELRRFETRMLEMEPEDLLTALRRVQAYVERFSLAFVKELASREGLQNAAFAANQWRSEEDWSLLTSWLTGPDERLSLEAAKTMTHLMQDRGSADRLDPAHLPLLIERLTGVDLGWRQSTYRGKSAPMTFWPAPPPSSVRGFVEYAKRASADYLLGELHRLLTIGRAWEGSPWTNPLFSGLADGIAAGLDARPPEDVDLPGYLDVVERWLDVIDSFDPECFEKEGREPTFPDSQFRRHVKYLLDHLPEAEATAFVRRLFAGPARGEKSWNVVLSGPTARSLRLVSAAWDAYVEAEGSFQDRGQILAWLPIFQNGPPPSGTEVEHAELVCGLIGRVDGNRQRQVRGSLSTYLSHLPADDARRCLLLAARALPRLKAGDRKTFLGKLISPPAARRVVVFGGALSEFRSAVVIPVLSDLMELSDGQYADEVLRIACRFLAEDASRKILLTDEARDGLAAILRENYGYLVEKEFNLLAGHPSLFPLEEWVRLVPEGRWRNYRHSYTAVSDRALQLAKKFVADPSRVNRTVVEFIQHMVRDKAERHSLLGKLLAEGDAKVVGRVVWSLQVSSTRLAPQILEGTLDRMLASEEEVSHKTIYSLARLLADTRPSEKLFPAARRLLSPDSPYPLDGIALAKQLGRPDLREDLVMLLDSMNAKVRDAAKDAIDSINALEVLRADWK